MLRSTAATIRMLAILGFLFAMPLLAFPPVRQWIDSCLSGSFTESQSVDPAVAPQMSGSAERIQPRLHAEPIVLKSPIAEPNPRVPLPSKHSRVAPPGNRLEAVQQHLRSLGAQAIAVERVDGQAPTFRFGCQMQLAGSAVYRKPFEAVAPDPGAAAARVLEQVEAWLKASRAAGGGAPVETEFFVGQSQQGLP